MRKSASTRERTGTTVAPAGWLPGSCSPDGVMELSTLVGFGIVVFGNVKNQSFQRVLVPLSGGHNSRFALEIAGLMVDKNRGRIVCLHIKQSRTPPFHVNDYLDSICSENNLPRALMESKVVESSNPVKAILRETADSELVVIGASRQAYWRRVVMGTTPEKVAKKCSKPLIMVKARGTIKAFIGRLFQQ
jgi:APA family basic amino acid/polyamine antiporter